MAYQTYTLVLLNSESEDQRMLTSNKLHAGINKTDKAQKFILTLPHIKNWTQRQMNIFKKLFVKAEESKTEAENQAA